MYAQNSEPKPFKWDSEMDGGEPSSEMFKFFMEGLWFVAERVYGNLVKAWNDPPCCCCLVFLGLFGIVALFKLLLEE
jgi:hypothetical protein